MNHKTNILSTLAFSLSYAVALLAPQQAMAQPLRLNSWKYLTDISLDLSQLVTGNYYEGTRLGLGFIFTTPLKYDIERPRDKQNSLQYSLYGAYGFRDKRLKGGASAALLLPMNRLRSVGFTFGHDVERAANRQLATYNFLSIINQTAYIASHYVGVDRFSVGVNQYLLNSWDMALHLRLSREDYRFDSKGLIYACYGDPTMPDQHYIEGQLTAKQRKGFTLQARVGRASGDNMESRTYATFIAQYAKEKTLNNRRADRLSLFVQAGYATDNAPYSRLFDLSGSDGSFLFFRNSFVSVQPNAYIANRYAMVCVNYLWGHPLWHASFSKPHFFAQISGMWGNLAHTRGDGIRYYSLLHESDRSLTDLATANREQILQLTAPDRGLFEVVLGFDRLIQWNALEVGFASAYPYSPASPNEINITFKVIANIAIDILRPY